MDSKQIKTESTYKASKNFQKELDRYRSLTIEDIKDNPATQLLIDECLKRFEATNQKEDLRRIVYEVLRKPNH